MYLYTFLSRFFLKSKKGQDGDGEEITVSKYFAVYKNLPLRDSADFPCINVGKPKKPSYFPLEVILLTFDYLLLSLILEFFSYLFASVAL